MYIHILLSFHIIYETITFKLYFQTKGTRSDLLSLLSLLSLYFFIKTAQPYAITINESPNNNPKNNSVLIFVR